MELLETFKFSVVDVIDIVLVAFLLYYMYKLVKGTVAINIFIGIVIVYLIWKLTQALQMQLLSNILGGFISVGMFALIVVFQQEIRKFLLMIGSTNIGNRKKFFKQLKFLKSETISETNIDAIVAACYKMSTSKTGALLVLERNNNLDFLVITGDEMNIKVTQPIIESIFFKNSPLHDGAIIIADNIIKATRVILPLNNEKIIPQRFGLRHRAAVGITEKTDALALVVSEETGQISYVKDGEFIMFKNASELTEMIKNDLA
ncbi:MAG: diadenylate cyclase CdaA [Flavobacteriaceae bacterium]|nr:diadenylate cyclase CdaA [Flavobacteriaceae bacterium]